MNAAVIAFTASRTGFSPPPPVVAEVLSALPEAEWYVTGACQGGDAFIGSWLYDRYPGTQHVVIVPADRSRVDPWWLLVSGPPVTVIEMPPGSTYAMRNAALVHRGDCLIAFPAWPEAKSGSARSGTWQTVRMARKAGKPVRWQCVMPPQERGDT